MYRHCEIALQRAAYLTPSHCSPFSVVPLWFALQVVVRSPLFLLGNDDVICLLNPRIWTALPSVIAFDHRLN